MVFLMDRDNRKCQFLKKVTLLVIIRFIILLSISSVFTFVDPRDGWSCFTNNK